MDAFLQLFSLFCSNSFKISFAFSSLGSFVPSSPWKALDKKDCSRSSNFDAILTNPLHGTKKVKNVSLVMT